MSKKLTRRDFLRGAALAGAGLAAAACQPAGPAEDAPAEAPKAEGNKPTTIQWMVWGGPERYQPFVDSYKKAFPELASWLTVELVSPGSGENDSYKALRLALAAGGEGLPDVCAFNYNGVPEFVTGGHVLELTNWMSKYEADMIDAAKNVARYEGKYYTVPNQLKPKAWFYRADMFDQAGIKPDEIKTFEDLMAAADKYHTTFPDSYMWNMSTKPAGYYYNEMLSHWDDSYFADKNGNYIFKDNPNFASVLTWLKEMGTTGVSLPVEDFSQDWGPAFADNKIGSSLIATWMTGFLPKYAPEQKGLWKLTLWPEFNRHGTDNGGQVQCILKQGKNPEAAWTFASTMYLTKEGAVNYWKYNGAPSPIKSGQEEIAKLAKSMTEKPADMTEDTWKVTPVNFFGGEFMDVVNETINYIKVFPWDPKGPAEMGIFQQHSQAFNEGKETLEEALGKAADDMKQQIGNPYQV